MGSEYGIKSFVGSVREFESESGTESEDTEALDDLSTDEESEPPLNMASTEAMFHQDTILRT